ncbi:MAG TPA: glycoside hydrolase family 44 protein [Candidatus Acidoferrum sp.]
MSFAPRLTRTSLLLSLTAALLFLFSGCGSYSSNGGGGGGGGNAPAAPTGLVAAAGDKQVALSWTAVSGATGYYAKRSTTAGGPYTQLSGTGTTNFTDTGLANGTKYYYVVSAYNSYGQSPNSAEVSATPTVPPPPAPAGLTAIVVDSQVALTWPISSGATSYNVKRSTTSGSGYAQIVNTTGTNFTDSGLTKGTTYYYVVSAVSGTGAEGPNSNQASATPVSGPADVTITVNPAVNHPISPYVYGTNFYGGNTSPQPHFTLDRDGGNRWTAYNWETNASNAGSDFNYQSDNYLSASNVPAEAVRSFIAGDQGAGLASLVTFQLQGYVSADESGPVLRPFPNLTRFKPVVDKKSTASNAPFTFDPTKFDADVYMDEFAWTLDQKFLSQNIFSTGAAQPTFISLDNEPDLWYSTHEEIQGSTIVNGQKANNLSAANFITKTVSLSTALKDLNKNAQSPAGHFSNVVIFGPVNYGFNGIYSWQGDPTLSPTPSGADWFADKYLAGIKAASTTYGAPLVDVYDFHWYSEATDGTTRVTNMNGSTLTDPQVQAIVQSPRSLWDPTFKENSWITNNVLNAPIQILTRLQAKIAANNPGMKLAITEYENGGFNHIAGTIAQADNLGIFGSMGLFAANFWPPSGTYSYTLAGFRAFRGFDGGTANFPSTSLQTTSSDVASVVVYAASDPSILGRICFVAINRSTSSKVTVINGQALAGAAHLYQMTSASAAGQSPVQPVFAGLVPASGPSLTITLPPLSVTTIDVD